MTFRDQIAARALSVCLSNRARKTLEDFKADDIQKAYDKVNVSATFIKYNSITSASLVIIP